jgi:hypothetical protein
MLYTRRQSSYRQWSTGAARFLCSYRQQGQKLIVGVRCRLGHALPPDWALLDTGAERSVISPEIGELLGDNLGERVGETRLSSRHGTVDAELRRLDIGLLADAGLGQDVIMPAVVAVPELWNGPVILGFFGFLEHLRVGLDPGQDAHTQPMLYFGPA